MTIKARNFVESLVSDVLLSFFMIIGITSILSALFLLTQRMMFTVTFMFGYFSILSWVLLWLKNDEATDIGIPSVWRIDWSFYASVGTILLVGLSFAVFRGSLFQWPQTAGTDTFSHLAAINQILSSGGTPYIIGGYSYIFHSMMAGLCILTKGNALWVVTMFHPFQNTYALIVIYLVLVAITKNTVLPMLATIATMAVFEHGGLLAYYYPFPVAFVFVFMFTIFAASYVFPASRNHMILLLLCYLEACLLYPGVILVSFPILVYLFVDQRFIPNRPAKVYKFFFYSYIAGGASLIVIYSLLLPALNITPPVITIGPLLILSDNAVSILHFTMAYSILQTITILFGLIFCTIMALRQFNMFQKWQEKMDFKLLALIGWSFLLLYFTPISYAWRTELFVRPFYALYATIGVASLVAVGLDQGGQVRRISFSFQMNDYKPKTLGIIIMVMFILGFVSYEKWDLQTQYFIHGEPRRPEFEEMSVFQWIQDNLADEDYVITDMATGFILRGIVLRNASTSFMVADQAQSPYNHPNLSNAIFGFFNASVNETIQSYNEVLNDPVLQDYVAGAFYILFSPRTNAWIQQGRNGVFSRSAPYRAEISSDDPALIKFTSSLFSTIYSDGEVQLLRINS
jgi:hypothetical protein